MASPRGDSVYSDQTATTRRRVEDLLDRMTLREKVAQLGSVNADRILDEDGTVDEEAVEELLSDGIGHLTRIGGEGGLPPERAAAVTNELQTYLIEETRLGVPAIPHEECLSGYMGPEGTTFPQGIGLASTWEPALVESVTSQIREQLQAIGTVHALSPVLDVARDPRWGRTEETFGEDQSLVAAMASAYVNGLQGPGHDGVSATMKHFVGHGATEGGKNRSSLEVGERTLREVHAYPFEAVLENADAEAVMNAYHDVDGVPCAASEWLLTDVLREEWGFDGTVVSDYYSVEFLKSEHGVAATEREAGVQAVEAGVDVELPYTDCYGEHLVEAVEEGDLAEATVDRAVRRVLRAKARKGVLDDPRVDADAAAEPFHTDEATDLTRRVARQSLTLLENDGLLPLDDPDEVAVVGPKADEARGMLGDYAYPAHYPDEEVDFDAPTPLDAMEERAAAEGFDVSYEAGCTTTGPETDGLDDAAAVAADADVAVAFVGARSAVDFSESDDDAHLRPTVSTSGEGCDVTDLGLPGVQSDLVERVHETGTPVVAVIVSGKPHSVDDLAERVPALVHAWLPGEEGGRAVADVLFGDHNPGGRLPVSVPRNVGQLPVHYNRKPNSANEEYVYDDGSPLYPFGYGLSYTDFEYGDCSLSTDSVGPASSVDVAVTVENAGDVAGHEVVQLYASPENPSVARPVRDLVGFQRVHLEPGEEKRVTFELDASRLAYHDRNVDLVVEEGAYELVVGRSATDVQAARTVEVTETKRVPAGARTFLTDTAVDDGE